MMNLCKVVNVMERVDMFHTKSYYETSLRDLEDKADSFFNIDTVVDKLIDTYNKYGTIIIAYDYDDTVCPSKPNYNCDNVVKLLKICSEFKEFEMVCYTARSTYESIDEVRFNLDRLGIRYDTINQDTPRIKEEIEHTYTSKVMYSIFLDDKAGLGEAFRSLIKFLEWYVKTQLFLI